jgi:hypothetical protein
VSGEGEREKKKIPLGNPIYNRTQIRKNEKDNSTTPL